MVPLPKRRSSASLRVPPTYLPECVPVVHALQPTGVGAICPGEELDRIDVVEAVVVVPDGVSHVVRTAVVDEKPRGGEDGRVGVVDVPALAVFRPRAWKKLHRSICARGRWSVNTPELALDEVDRGKVAGVDPVAVLRL